MVIKALIKAAITMEGDLTVEEIETAHEMCNKVDITWWGNRLEK